jgi:putative DNA primase/helicase
MHSFNSFIAAQGIIPPDFIDAGKWYRCKTVSHPKKKNGTIKLSDDGLVGWVQDFAIHSEPIMWRANGADAVPILIDQAAIAKRNTERRQALVAATMGARAFYAQCKPLKFSHPYLTNKGLGVAGCEGLRVDDKGNLIIPMLYNSKILSVQRISAEGEKKFHYGATTKGAYYLIDRPGSTLTALVEGFATGCTIFNAVPSCRVLVCFNAGNIPVVAETVKRYGMGVICGDNDQETFARIGKNPGLEAAHKAAEMLGVGVAYPECAGSDWNDYAVERIEALYAAQSTGFGRKQTILQIEAIVHAEIRLKIMRAAKLLRRSA